MPNFISAATLTGDRVLQYPSISRLFAENRIDLCCSGNVPIHEVLEEKGLNIDEFLIRVNALVEIEVNK